ncbi:uncharacterized protein LOC135197449 [Macrobrachium nipponense]|uniref:uncharacterized protein LOC135197449 n=1 Tax=Macrobrachium nipponense TaxID=159736 RepID=UPI0030C7B7DC
MTIWKILREKNQDEGMEFKALQLRADERAKEREHEIEVLKLQIKLNQGKNGSYNNSSVDETRFNMFAALKLVPHFSEEEVNEFFVSFEKIAKKLAWPKDMWTTLVQCRLVGKAQRVYNNLNDDLSADYDTVKSIVLKAYDLVPEAYRQKFRNLRKDLDVTYVEFARKKVQFLDDWLKSKEVDNFVKLKELLLAEEFKRNVSRDLRIHLEELKLDSIQEIAVASDEYALTHREEPLRKRINQDRFSPHEYNTRSNNRQSSRGTLRSNNDESEKVSNQDRSVSGSRSFVNSRRSVNGGGSSGRNFGTSSSSSVKCYWCHKTGHVKANCYGWKNFQERRSNPVNIVVAEKTENLKQSMEQEK